MQWCVLSSNFDLKFKKVMLHCMYCLHQCTYYLYIFKKCKKYQTSFPQCLYLLSHSKITLFFFTNICRWLSSPPWISPSLFSPRVSIDLTTTNTTTLQPSSPSLCFVFHSHQCHHCCHPCNHKSYQCIFCCHCCPATQFHFLHNNSCKTCLIELSMPNSNPTVWVHRNLSPSTQ